MSVCAILRENSQTRFIIYEFRANFLNFRALAYFFVDINPKLVHIILKNKKARLKQKLFRFILTFLCSLHAHTHLQNLWNI